MRGGIRWTSTPLFGSQLRRLAELSRLPLGSQMGGTVQHIYALSHSEDMGVAVLQSDAISRAVRQMTGGVVQDTVMVFQEKEGDPFLNLDEFADKEVALIGQLTEEEAAELLVEDAAVSDDDIREVLARRTTSKS